MKIYYQPYLYAHQTMLFYSLMQKLEVELIEFNLNNLEIDKSFYKAPLNLDDCLKMLVEMNLLNPNLLNKNFKLIDSVKRCLSSVEHLWNYKISEAQKNQEEALTKTTDYNFLKLEIILSPPLSNFQKALVGALLYNTLSVYSFKHFTYLNFIYRELLGEKSIFTGIQKISSYKQKHIVNLYSKEQILRMKKTTKDTHEKFFN